MRTLSLHAFLVRLIWLCVLPLVVLAVYLAVNHVKALQVQFDHDAMDRVQNAATAVDHHIGAQISALQLLAASPLADKQSRLKEFYREAQGFRETFGGHVVLADPTTQMLFNTRVPLGTHLPRLPLPRGHAAAPAVLQTGKPAVGDMFLGPVAKQMLVTVMVPVLREGRIRFLLLSAIETRQFQHQLDKVALSSAWSLTLLDGKGEVMARRGASEREQQPAVTSSDRRFVAKSTLSHWSVVLDVPRHVYQAPIIVATAALAVTIFFVALLSIGAGRVIGRRLARQVASLVESPPTYAPRPLITEVEAVRSILMRTAEAREAAEATQLESEHRFRRLFDLAPVPLGFVDKVGNLTDCNARFVQTFGYTHEDVPTLEEWWRLAYPDPDYRRRVIETWEAGVRCARESNTGFAPIEYRVTCKGGEVRTILISGIALGDDIMAAFFDITERKQTEDALHKSEAKYRLIADNTDDWVYWVTPDGNVRYTSPSCERVTGYSVAEFSGNLQLIRKIVHPDDREAFERHSVRARKENRPGSLEFRIITKTGEIRWISHACGPIYTAEGQYAGRRGTNQNITARKKAEEEIRKLNAELEQRVVERTSQLEAVNKELESFAYSVSHDLRAPLRSIDGFSQALLEDCRERLDDMGKQYLDRVRKATQRMGMLIDDLLKLSRVTRADLHDEAVDLSGMVLQIAGDCQGHDLERHVEMVIREGVTVQGDPLLMRIALGNLMDNAWKFTGREVNPRIEFGTTVNDGETSYFIRDNGVGFDMAYADKLFTPFQRLHATEDFTGTGIGLATVKRIINRHGGRVWAEAEVGKGATFYFTLQGTGVGGQKLPSSLGREEDIHDTEMLNGLRKSIGIKV